VTYNQNFLFIPPNGMNSVNIQTGTTNSTIYTTLSLVPGITYQLRFWASPRINYGYPSQFTVIVCGTVIYNQVPTVAYLVQVLSNQFVATSTACLLSFFIAVNPTNSDTDLQVDYIELITYTSSNANSQVQTYQYPTYPVGNWTWIKGDGLGINNEVMGSI